VLRFLIRWFRSRKEKQKTRFFPLFLVVGLENVSFVFVLAVGDAVGDPDLAACSA
jgi:hypothetical protein